MPSQLLSPSVVYLGVSSCQLLLPPLPSSRPPLPHPLLLHQPHVPSYTDSHPSLSFTIRPHRFFYSSLPLPLAALIFDNILLDSLFDRTRLRSEPPYLSCLYLTSYRQTHPRSYSFLVIASQKSFSPSASRTLDIVRVLELNPEDYSYISRYSSVYIGTLLRTNTIYIRELSEEDSFVLTFPLRVTATVDTFSSLPWRRAAGVKPPRC